MDTDVIWWTSFCGNESVYDAFWVRLLTSLRALLSERMSYAVVLAQCFALLFSACSRISLFVELQSDDQHHESRPNQLFPRHSVAMDSMCIHRHSNVSVSVVF